MTVVITILASDNAKNRRRTRRAEQQAQKQGDTRLARKIAVAASGCSMKVVKAVSCAEGYGRQLQKAIKHHEPIAQKREEKQRREHMKVRNPLGQQINARQKMHGKSIPLI